MAEILIIDDEFEMLKICKELLQSFGHKPVALSDPVKALSLIEEYDFDLILCDLFMPEVDGVQILKKVQQERPATPFIIFTAYGTVDRAVDSMKAGAFDFIEKPFDANHLNAIIEKGLKQRKLILERDQLKRQLDTHYSFDNIIGRSQPILKVFDLIKSVAETDANVIITGESGTGKELVAQSIHSRSKRKTNAFIPVNCGALPENIFESELFGYEKGAFTGANRRKHGLLELANDGTFFLDEVCELTESFQVKLLRVLQDHKVRRLGGEELKDLNVRFIAATNRDVEVAVKEGRLREDFYFRLNVIGIHVPALRERREDIALLTKHFLRVYLKTSPQKITGFTDSALSYLEHYSWPGNVRELQNVVERSVTIARHEQITPDELPVHLRTQSKQTGGLFENQTLVQAKQQAIENTEVKYLLAQLRKHMGNVTEISRESGMTRRNLHHLLKKYSLDANAWRIKKETKKPPNL